MADKNVVVYGDSVTWGQGHTDQDKFANQVARALGATPMMTAHSGATIGRGDAQTGRCGPESPDHYPTILQQLADAIDDPDQAAVVIVDGGINDIGVPTILSPLTSKKHLRNVTRRYCHDDLMFLLTQILARYQSAATKIVVTCYFPIFSTKSDFRRVLTYLQALAIAPPPNLQADVEQRAFAFRSIELALLFWHESRARLQSAVDDIGSGRVVFADVPYQEDNAMFADNPWLFNVHLQGGRLEPEDDVIAARHEQCVKCHPHDPFGVFACGLASAGHPNRVGADQFAKTILQALGH
jgi:lysophospholipase L1-like esterase